jgi:hypothetical protein
MTKWQMKYNSPVNLTNFEIFYMRKNINLDYYENMFIFEKNYYL